MGLEVYNKINTLYKRYNKYRYFQKNNIWYNTNSTFEEITYIIIF